MTKTAVKPQKTLFSEHGSLEELAEAAKDCKACDLWKRGTQTVFGEGGARAKVMFVGEQPGNQEDLEGKPFVGPAGKLLDAMKSWIAAQHPATAGGDAPAVSDLDKWVQERSQIAAQTAGLTRQGTAASWR